MSKCTDTNIGVRLHAYEIGQLSDDASDQFEMHLMECRYCFSLAEKFEPAVELLQSDADLKNIVANANVNKELSTSWFKELLHQLWPKTSFMLKPAVGYFLLALMIYPAYLGFQEFNKPSAEAVIPIVLTSNRATAVPILVEDQRIVIMFRINGATIDKFYSVKITSEEGNQVYKNASFNNFDDLEMASLLLHSEYFEPGNYLVEVTQPDDRNFKLSYNFTIR